MHSACLSLPRAGYGSEALVTSAGQNENSRGIQQKVNFSSFAFSSRRSYPMTPQKKLSRLNKWVRRAFRRRLANEHAWSRQCGQLYLMVHLSPACWRGFQRLSAARGTLLGARTVLRARGPPGEWRDGHWTGPATSEDKCLPNSPGIICQSTDRYPAGIRTCRRIIPTT